MLQYGIQKPFKIRKKKSLKIQRNAILKISSKINEKALSLDCYDQALIPLVIK